MSTLQQAEKVNGTFRDAVLTDSLWGGNTSAFILSENGLPNGRVELPRSTGDRKRDAEIFQEIRQGLNSWKQTGEFPDSVSKYAL